MSLLWLRDIVVGAAAAIIAIVLHELAHGYAALALGDRTAADAGRLSFNPLRHVDRFGTIILPLFLLASQLLTIGRIAFMFGWAKPVPVDASLFPNPRRDMALVAAAGPLSNFILAFLAALALRAAAPGSLIAIFLLYFLMFNIVLGLFNLIPLPPFDGGRIAVGVLPLKLARALAQVERAGLLLILLLIFILPALLRQFGIQFNPVGEALGVLVPRVTNSIMQLAGNHAVL
jgi:Zn-dependent protease